MTTTDMIVDEAERLQARVRELEAALEHVEWAAEDDSTHEQMCPDCGNYRRDGHQFMCKLSAALTSSEPRR